MNNKTARFLTLFNVSASVDHQLNILTHRIDSSAGYQRKTSDSLNSNDNQISITAGRIVAAINSFYINYQTIISTLTNLVRLPV